MIGYEAMAARAVDSADAAVAQNQRVEARCPTARVAGNGRRRQRRAVCVAVRGKERARDVAKAKDMLIEE